MSKSNLSEVRARRLKQVFRKMIKAEIGWMINWSVSEDAETEQVNKLSDRLVRYLRRYTDIT